MIGPAVYTDRASILDIDLKCFYRPWTEDLWDYATQNYYILVARCHGHVLGFSVYGNDSSKDRTVRLLKLGVKPIYRNHGVGTLLLHSSIAHIRQYKQEIEAWLPEQLVYEGAGHFLLKHDFKAFDVKHDIYSEPEGPEAAILFRYYGNT